MLSTYLIALHPNIFNYVSLSRPYFCILIYLTLFDSILLNSNLLICNFFSFQLYTIQILYLSSLIYPNPLLSRTFPLCSCHSSSIYFISFYFISFYFSTSASLSLSPSSFLSFFPPFLPSLHSPNHLKYHIMR